jgi:hypothetical protein
MKRWALILGLAAYSTTTSAQTLSITATDCSNLVRHAPAPDVAYRPGTDARGRPVAPADLNPAPQIRVPDTIVFDAAADLRRFGIPASSPLFQPNVMLGEVHVDKEGRAFFNGQPLGDPEIAALEAFCRRRLELR